jgi:hypothetical protein
MEWKKLRPPPSLEIRPVERDIVLHEQLTLHDADLLVRFAQKLSDYVSAHP